MEKPEDVTSGNRKLMIAVALSIATCVFTTLYLYKRRRNTGEVQKEINTHEDDQETQSILSNLQQNEQFTKLLDHLQQDLNQDWEQVKSIQNIQVFRKISEEGIAVIRAKAILQDISPDIVFKAIWDAKVRQSWDQVLLDFHTVEQIDYNDDVIYFWFKSPMSAIIKDRDFLQRRSFVEFHGQYVISYRSVEHELMPLQEKRIRANTIVSGYRLYKDSENQNNTILEFLSQNDLKGQIPVKLINTFAPRKAREWIGRLNEACKKLKEA